jgi:histidine ammonia-lyase
MKNVYQIGSGDLTFDIIERIINENLKLELAPEAKLRIQKCRDYLDKKIAESEEPLYGITTGFGSLCSKSISSDELGTLQENLIKSHVLLHQTLCRTHALPAHGSALLHRASL